MTLPLLVVDDPTLQFNFDRIAEAVVETGGESLGMRSGSQTISFTAIGQDTGAVTVNHGLGKTPARIYLTPQTGTGSPFMWFPVLGPTIDATSFTVRGWQVTNFNGTPTFYWFVLG